MTDGICPFAQWIPGVRTFQAGHLDRVGFADHTAGGYYATLANPGFWNSAGVSVHFNIAQDGRLCQTVNLFDTAFAQGRLGPKVIWPPYQAMGQQNPNLYLISTEHEDKTVTNYRWAEEMYQTDLRVKRWCIDEVKRVLNKDLMRFGFDSLAGHYMFDQVNRPYCPGNGWPRERLYTDLLVPPIPVVPPVLEDSDMMIPHNAKASWFDGRKLAGGGPWIMRTRSDLDLPDDAKMVRLDVYLASGPLTFRHANGLIAGVVEAGTLHQEIDVLLNDDGTCIFEAVAPIEFRLLGALGYWR